MIPRDKRQAPQRDLLETYLEDILNSRHELVQMGKRIDWTACEQHFGQLYAVEAGRQCHQLKPQKSSTSC